MPQPLFRDEGPASVSEPVAAEGVPAQLHRLLGVRVRALLSVYAIVAFDGLVEGLIGNLVEPVVNILGQNSGWTASGSLCRSMRPTR